MEVLARSGFVAKGTVYFLLGYLGLRAALGDSAVAGTQGVLLEILRAPMGRLLLGILAAGLAWYSVWRFIEAFADANRKGTEPKGLAARGIYLVSGLIYSALALDAAAIVLRWDNDSGQVRSVAGPLLHGPLAVLAGAGVAAYGAYQLWKGVRGKLSKQLDAGQAQIELGRWGITVSRFGLAGRGFVFVMLGYWLITHPASGPAVASDSGGAAGSLRLLARLPQGDGFLLVAAAGLMAYGVYQLVHSRYRRITVP